MLENKIAAALRISLCTMVPYFAAPFANAGSLDLGSLQFLFDEPITTSVTGMPMREGDVPADIEIITAEQIRRSGAIDLPEVLDRVAGIDVIQWTSAHYDVAIRGYNEPYNPRLLVLVDGRQVYLDHYGMTSWLSLPVELDDIRQIEVVRGPNTALFGFNAVSGVVNIITYDPLYDDIGSVRLTATGDGIDASTTAGMRQPEKWGVKLSAGIRDEGRYHEPKGGLHDLFAAEPKRRALAADGVAQIGESTHFGIDASYVDTQLTEFTPTYVTGRSEYALKSIRARLSHDTSDFGLWKLGAYHNRFDGSIEDAVGLLVAGRPIVGRNGVTVVQLENQFIPAAGHALRLAAEYRENTLETNFFGSTTVGYDVAALSGTWNWDVTDSLSLIASGRIDRLRTFVEGAPLAPFTGDDYDNVYYEPSYNLGAAYSIGEHDRLKLLAARGVQTPSLLQLSFAFPPSAINGGLPVVADPRLEPSVIETVELAYEHEFPEIDASASVAVFGQRHTDLQSLPGRGPGTVALINGFPAITTFNVGDSNAFGVEVEFDGKIGDHWNYGASYSFIDVDDDLTFNAGPAVEMPVRYAGATPRHVGKLEIGFEDGPWSADLFLRAASSRKLIGNPNVAILEIEDFDADINADLRVGYEVSDQFELSFAALDVFGERRQSSGAEIDRRFLLTARLSLN